MAATAKAMHLPTALSSALSLRRRTKFPARNGLTIGVQHIQTAPFRNSVTVRASDPQREQIKSDGAFTSQEDLSYLWKLGAGSVIGAAAIKYGSVLFPAITKPNLVEAIIIIFVPVIVAVFILFNQSCIEQ